MGRLVPLEPMREVQGGLKGNALSPGVGSKRMASIGSPVLTRAHCVFLLVVKNGLDQDKCE